MEVQRIKAADAPFSDSLYFASGALTREIESLANECWKPAGISPSSGHILCYLLNYANVTGPMVLARNLLLSPSTVTRLLDKLEKKGLVHRYVFDGIRMVELTQKAWQLEPIISECDFQFRTRCQELLGEEQNMQICQLLTATTDKLQSAINVRKATEKPQENTDLYVEK